MEELKLLNAKAAEWVSARDAKHYCRAFFSTFPKCDMLLNNICESWNSCILNFREKPILTMCENLRMQKNRDWIMMISGQKVCPKILKIVEEGKERASRYRAYKSIGAIYEVDDDNFKPFKLDLSQRQCSCRRWDLTGIPCSHAIAAIRKNGELPEDYVHTCYSVESYLKAYEAAILPIHASELWHKTNLPAPIPPKYKAQPGRPTKKRKVDKIVESKENTHKEKWKKGEVKRCRVCDLTGHNKITCKNKNPQVGELVREDVVHEQHADAIGGQFQNVFVEAQVPNFVLEEIDLMSSQPSQAVRNGGPQVSAFISSQISSTGAENVITRRGKNYVTVSTLQQKQKKKTSKKNQPKNK